MKKIALLLAISTMAMAAPAAAQVNLTTGSGSAVTTVDASANFEFRNELTDNPYLEGGLSFTRNGISMNNNGCGFAGCGGHVGFTGFSGNYLYGTGNTSSYLEITRAGGGSFTGLEFIVGTGFFKNSADLFWDALLNGSSVGSGSATLGVGTVVGFSGSAFDTLRYYDTSSTFTNLHAPAIDSVVAQFKAGGAVPEPATWALMVLGVGLAGAAMRRKQQAQVRFAF